MTASVRRPVTRPSVALRDLAWVAVGALFVATRIATAVRAPVAGPELEALSGALNAARGIDDGRFLGTLAQWTAAVVLKAEGSETFARLPVLAASAMVPPALYAGRRVLGETGALASLLLLAIDPVAMLLGSTATASGFDQAVAAWLFVALTSANVRPVTWVGLGLGIATGGTLPAVLGAAALCRFFATGRHPQASVALPLAAGIAAGVFLASLGYALLPPSVRIPPFDAVTAGLDRPWSPASVAELSMLYEAPLLLAGGAVVAWRLAGGFRLTPAGGGLPLVHAWVGVAAAYFVAGLPSHDAGVVIALGFPLCLVVGASLDALIARTGHRLVAAAAASAGALGLLLTAAGAGAMIGGDTSEPLLSPSVGPGAAEVHRVVRAQQPTSPGGIVIHPSLAGPAAWVFRDLGPLVVASRVPRSDAVVIWPAESPRPPGYQRLGEPWQLVRLAAVPPATFEGLVRWFTRRATGDSGGTTVAVYTGTP